MLNHIVLQGRLCAAPELRHTTNGTPVVSADLAVQRARKDAGGERKTDFIPLVIWGKSAEMTARFFEKGSMLIAEGRLETRKWTDKDGKTRVSYELQVESLHFCESKGDGAGKCAGSTPQAYQADDFTELSDDDVPF